VSHAHPPAAEAGDAEQFRAHARAVLADVARTVGWRTRPAAGTGDDYDRERRREFDRLLAAAGWAGIAIPKEFGGAGRGLAQGSAERCLQAMGGIGFTWESDVHRYLKAIVRLRHWPLLEQQRRGGLRAALLPSR
jgi:alkylation response protein AidB-like acyl-CoA dehydrogenase